MTSRLKWLFIAIGLAAALTGQINSDICAQDSSGNWTVQPFAEALTLLRVEQSSSTIKFVLQNVQDKVITAYSVCFSRGERFSSCRDVDWSTSDASRGLGKRDTDTSTIGVEEASQYKNHVLRIAAVLFDDGTSEGLHDDILQINLKRLGKALEYRREIDILSSFSNTSLSDLDIERLSEKIGPVIANSRDPRFIDDVKIMSGYGLAMPELNTLSEPMRVSLLSGISSARGQLLQSVDLLRKRPSTSANSRIQTRTMMMSDLTAKIDGTRSRMFEICKRTERGKKDD